MNWAGPLLKQWIYLTIGQNGKPLIRYMHNIYLDSHILSFNLNCQQLKLALKNEVKYNAKFWINAWRENKVSISTITMMLIVSQISTDKMNK